MRSTLLASAGSTVGVMSIRTRALERSSDSSTDSAYEIADVGGLELGRDDAAREPIEVEQVGHEPVEPARVPGDPPGEILGVVLLELHVAALQRDRESQDRGERGAQVVRDRLQEGVLHLVERPQAPGRLALDGERALELRLGLLALGDVEQEPLPVGLSALEPYEPGLVLHPHHPPVLREHPVLEREVVVALAPVALGVGREDPLAVVGVHDPAPERRVGLDLLRACTRSSRCSRGRCTSCSRSSDRRDRSPACRRSPGSARRSSGTSARPR